MLTIRCGQCRKKIIRYHKHGEGQLIRCWKDNIKEDYTLKEEYHIQCSCGNKLGRDEGAFLKLKKSAIVITGRAKK